MTHRSDPVWDLDGPEYEKPQDALGGLTIEEYEARTARIKQILEFQMEGMQLVLHALHGGGTYGREALDTARIEVRKTED